ncbi:hypothetical protein Lal_00010170 [Lupinus albus]|uniref:Putative vacuolar protein sorting-associated protein Ist1 n=1 Tax=Lupinus albus TaxID=3870 RepID=A0A6A4MQ04_LUPAL|nr:putative vacuolar protein sorting-associated protein Ist1 [Lupinus albus]KAF1859586.1 hypothetical protein Lal_00010170 [Lupinus albus]
MFEGLFKPKFYSKCKSYARLIKMRLEAIQKKRNAVQKFLKKDIADLLRSGLEYNAYGRAEGLLVEQNMSSCYELIAKFIGCISDYARDLCKQRECPDECKEAIPSLIYAAARFSDLPELRELRKMFTEKFGSSLEPYASKEFVNKLRQEPPSKEMKVQLLSDLAQEFSIKWDNKALEQRLYSPPQLHEEKPKHGPMNNHNDEKWHKMDNVLAMPKINERDGKKDIDDASWRVQSSIASDDEKCRDKLSHDSQTKASSSSFEVENKRSFSYGFVPPPYVKEILNDKGESNLKKAIESSNHDLHEPVDQKKPIPKSVRTRSLKPHPPNQNDTVSDSKTGGNEKEGDMLLMHYSKKEPPYTKSGSSAAPIRGISFPYEHITSKKTLKGHERATSLVPEMLSTERHVHPSLPDFDDFKAHITYLRGR